MTDLEMLIITYGEQTRWAGYYSEGVEADIKNEDALSTLTKLKAEIDRLNAERAEALLSAERAREERNREHVRLNAEWMAKCEELRKDAERYRFLEKECRTGSYRGIISREAIDTAMAKKEGA